MSDFESSDVFQVALDRINELAGAAAAAAGVSATAESDLVRVTMSAVPQIEALDYSWTACRTAGADAMAAATRSTIGDAVVEVQQAQSEALRSSPALASLVDATQVEGFAVPPEVAEKARRAAAALQSMEFTAADREGRVEATVDGSGVLTRLWFSATASREAAADWLPEAARATINDALSQARRAQEGELGDAHTSSIEAELDEIVGAHEARLAGLESRLDEVSRRLGLD